VHALGKTVCDSFATDGEVISAFGRYRERETYSVEPSSRSLNALCPFIFFQHWKSGLGERNAQPCYTGFALSDLVVSGALPPEGNSALHRFPQAPTA
jgi:hypothetical protein